MQISPLSEVNGVKILSEVSSEFEDVFLKFLRKENRLYGDAEVRELPSTFFYNLHRQEWELKSLQLNRLTQYLKRVNQNSRILDLGCGNGWLASHIARMEQFEVWGMDISLFLLQQAARVFQNPRLHFIYGNIFENILPEASFDGIILSESIQYFSDFQQLISRCRHFLKKGGEIHILNSPLYQEKEIVAEIEKSSLHFESLGVPEMTDLYFHHLRQELAPFDFQFLYKPQTFGMRWFRSKDSPYPWVKIIN